jgi:hypothetical protein
LAYRNNFLYNFAYNLHKVEKVVEVGMVEKVVEVEKVEIEVGYSYQIELIGDNMDNNFLDLRTFYLIIIIF